MIGVDNNPEVVAYSNSRKIPNAEFRQLDLRTFRDPDLLVDGIWSSFTAAYFPDFRNVLSCWLEHLRPGGWIEGRFVEKMREFGGFSPEIVFLQAENDSFPTRKNIFSGILSWPSVEKLSACEEY